MSVYAFLEVILRKILLVELSCITVWLNWQQLGWTTEKEGSSWMLIHLKSEMDFPITSEIFSVLFMKLISCLS